MLRKRVRVFKLTSAVYHFGNYRKEPLLFRLLSIGFLSQFSLFISTILSNFFTMSILHIVDDSILQFSAHFKYVSSSASKLTTLEGASSQLRNSTLWKTNFSKCSSKTSIFQSLMTRLCRFTYEQEEKNESLLWTYKIFLEILII